MERSVKCIFDIVCLAHNSPILEVKILGLMSDFFKICISTCDLQDGHNIYVFAS